MTMNNRRPTDKRYVIFDANPRNVSETDGANAYPLFESPKVLPKEVPQALLQKQDSNKRLFSTIS